MKEAKKKILLATGGTGGHLFPAQAIAVEILGKKPNVELLFAGSGLKNNRFFDKSRFTKQSDEDCSKYKCHFENISSATIIRRNLFQLVKAPFKLIKGIFESVALFRSFRPDFVVGFGSFHTFPLLVVATFKKVPFVLFEPNAYPSRVNRLFSKWAKWTAIYFPDVRCHLKSPCRLIQMPFWRGLLEKAKKVSREEALSYLTLSAKRKTLLIFGGSQGALSINQLVSETFVELEIDKNELQVVHITGNTQATKEMDALYKRLGIRAKVKDFELHMHLIWPGIDLAICRAGAGSSAELINYSVPSILYPYRYAANDHQKLNGKIMKDKVKGAITQEENSESPGNLRGLLQTLLDSNTNQLANMRDSIKSYSQRKVESRPAFSQLILEEVSK